MSLSYGRTPTVDTVLHATGGDIQKIYNLVGVPEFIKVAAAMTARRYHDAVQGSANPNPPSIAAQAFGNPPGVPVGAAGAPPAGLGATPQAAPPMAPQMPAAPEMAVPEEAPMGMAEGGMVPPYAAGGGLSDVPVPDGMFDEPSNGGFNDGYSGGGLVAFAGGSPGELKDPSDWGAYIEEMALGVAPNLGVTSRLRSAARNKQVGGVPDSYHTIDAARDFQPPKGMSMGQLHAQLKQQFGSDYDVINEGDHVHVEPGPVLGKQVRAGTAQTPLKERNVESPEGRRASFEDQYAIAKKRFGELSESGLGELEAYYRGELAPEKAEKARKDDMWMALAQIGASMAGTNSPYLLQAAGQAIAATLPGVAAGKKERKAAEREARTGLREVLGLKRSEQKEVLEYAKDLYGIEQGAETSELERKERRAADAAARQHDKDMAALGQTYALDRITAEGKVNNTQFEKTAAAHRARILDRINQGLPVKAPDGTVLDTRGGRLAASELDTLANNWAIYDMYRYRSNANASGGYEPYGGATATGAGTGASGSPVVDVNYGGM